MRIVARVNQLRGDSDFFSGTLHRAFDHRVDTQLLRDFG